MKIAYRILLLLFLFCGAIAYFGSNMQEKVFRADKRTIAMQETTLPVVAIRSEQCDVNELRGYCSNLDAMLVRESITPLPADKTLELRITENEYNIKKVNYEVYETGLGAKVESGSIISLDKLEREDGSSATKAAKLKLGGEYAAGTEYVVKLTLISNESKRIYYYTRIKQYSGSHLQEKLDFVKMFHSSLLDKENAANVSKYLETKKNADETDFAHADIHNSLDFLSYADLAPEEIFCALPLITEYTQDMASVVLSSYMSVETPTGREFYFVTEKFRFRYTPSRMYLYSYDRAMEAVFDVKNTSLAKSEFKLGITGDTDRSMLANKDNTRIAFVCNNSLYVYTAADNTLTTAFTFRQKNTDYLRDTYDKHDIRILSVDDAGEVDFLVYGYMNRGEYEGRVAMILYTYFPQDKTIQERAYFPVNTTYELLKETLGEFAYCNMEEIFYFHIYDTIYSYNLITKSLCVIAENVSEEDMVYSPERRMIAWQSADAAGSGECVHVLNLDTGERGTIDAAAGEIIGLLGAVDTNLIIGRTSGSDREIREDGSVVVAYRKVSIVDFDGNSLKDYEKPGYFVVAADTRDNVIRLDRVVENSSGQRRFCAAEADYILNQYSPATSSVHLSQRVTDRMRKEYYLSLPETVNMEKIPATAGTRNTVISEDVTVRVNVPEYFNTFYLVYAFGEVVYYAKEPGPAIVCADEAEGSVVDSSGRVLWTRGVKASSAEVAGISVISAGENMNSLMACVRRLLEYNNVEAEVTAYDPAKGLLTDWIKRYTKTNVMKLTDASLDEVLYFVYQKSPVIAVSDEGTAMLITGYDAYGITVIQPVQGRKRHLTVKDAEAFLGEQDYYYIVAETKK